MVWPTGKLSARQFVVMDSLEWENSAMMVIISRWMGAMQIARLNHSLNAQTSMTYQADVSSGCAIARSEVNGTTTVSIMSKAIDGATLATRVSRGI
jgi:hypothetical protein